MSWLACRRPAAAAWMIGCAAGNGAEVKLGPLMCRPDGAAEAPGANRDVRRGERMLRRSGMLATLPRSALTMGPHKWGITRSPTPGFAHVLE